MQHADEENAYLRFRDAIQIVVDDVIEGLPVIDCNNPVFSTDKVFPALHNKDGKLKWDIELQANALLKVDNLTHDKLERITGLPVLNANVLDCLIKRQYLVPNEWNGKVIHFLGTRYSDYSYNSPGYLQIRSMYQKEGSGEWSWEYNICDNDLCCITGYIALRGVTNSICKK